VGIAHLSSDFIALTSRKPTDYFAGTSPTASAHALVAHRHAYIFFY
jgi:hypothetical protein